MPLHSKVIIKVYDRKKGTNRARYANKNISVIYTLNKPTEQPTEQV